MILVAFWHGLRASEVTGGWHTITVNKVKTKVYHPGIRPMDLRDGHLTVQRLKGSNRTTQALVSDANPLLNEREPLIEYVRNLLPNQRIFPVGRQHFWRCFQRYAKLAGIPAHKQHPHVLKHTVATLSLNAGAKIHEVQRRLGHRSMGSTGIYTQATDEQADNAIRRALQGPRGV